jgi:hypothetical protein
MRPVSRDVFACGPVGRFFRPVARPRHFQRSRKIVELRSVYCRSTGIGSEQNSKASSAWWPYSKVGLALPPFALNRLAKSLRCYGGRVGALAVSGNGDGEEPWSEDDLFDLDSALSFGARIEEIAVFLRREVDDVERKALERNRPNSANLGLIAPNRPNSRVDFVDPAASSEARKPQSAGARNPAPDGGTPAAHRDAQASGDGA